MPHVSSHGKKPRRLDRILRRTPKPRIPTKVLTQTGKTYYLSNCIIGTGSFSRCYAAVTLESRTIYAVKSMDRSRIKADSAAHKRLIREVIIHRSLQHPNIVRFLDYGEDEYNVYLVLDFCSYQSLRRLVDRCFSLAERDARKLFVPILDAVLYLHKQNIHHGDLKLSNVLLDRDMRPLLCDFGFAMALESPRCLRTKACGTPAYMAPEILQTPTRFGLKADVWSLGVMLYNMVYGITPFHANTVAGVCKRIRAHELRFPFGVAAVSEDAIDLMYNMLNPDPSVRWSAETASTHVWLINPEKDRSVVPPSHAPVVCIEEVFA